MAEKLDAPVAVADVAAVAIPFVPLRKLGDLQAGSMRKVGYRHAIVTKPVVAELVDINSLRNSLAQTMLALPAARAQVAQLELMRRDLETKLAEFDAAPVQRIDGDPDVPVEAPKPDPTPAKKG